MTHKERIREILAESPNAEHFRKMREAGWQLVGLEWERQADGPPPTSHAEEIPYGLEVAPDCLHLRQNPHEMEILTRMMDLIVDDKPMSHVAAEINRQGYRDRTGRAWTRQQVFQMLPRLIEVGPVIFSTEEWNERRERFVHNHRGS